MPENKLGWNWQGNEKMFPSHLETHREKRVTGLFQVSNWVDWEAMQGNKEFFAYAALLLVVERNGICGKFMSY